VAYGARWLRQFKERISKGFSAANRAVEQIANLGVYRSSRGSGTSKIKDLQNQLLFQTAPRVAHG
jgi:hypothetical protein